MELIKDKPESYLKLKNTKLTETMLDSVEIEKIAIEPLLFQTGYLTVKEIPPAMGSPIYHVEIPNMEVREAFNLHILSAMTECDDVSVGRARTDIAEALKDGDLEHFLDILRGLFASIPYNLHVNSESYYHSIFYAVMNVLGMDMYVEVSVSRGRVDAIIEIEDKAYVMEFKYKTCPPDASDEEKRKLFDAALAEAMEQIETKGYADKYKGSSKTVYKAALAFLGRDEIEMRVES